MIRRRSLVVLGAGAALAGCTLAARTGVIRKDVLTDAQQVIVDMKIDHGDMTISAATDHADTTYEPGQPIVLSATLSKDGYVAILRVLPNGTTTLLFPNSAHPIAFIAANKTLTVPAPDEAVKFTAGKPGVELYEFIASTDTRSWLFSRKPSPGKDVAELGMTTRSLAKEIATSLNIGGGRDTVAAYVTVRVR